MTHPLDHLTTLSGDYGRYAPGLNHFGFSAPSAEAAEAFLRSWSRRGSRPGSSTSSPASPRCSSPIPMRCGSRSATTRPACRRWIEGGEGASAPLPEESPQ